MTEVLCFGDSNTWGYNPKDGSRFPWEIRWTGRLQKELQGDGIRVLEEGLCGRTTIFEDPLRQGRRGTELFPVLLETHGQPEFITLMLGTNDCKTVFSASADVIGKGVARLLEQPGSVHQRAECWSSHRSIWVNRCGRTALTPNFHRNPWKYQSGSVMFMRRSPTDTEPHSFALLTT